MAPSSEKRGYRYVYPLFYWIDAISDTVTSVLDVGLVIIIVQYILIWLYLYNYIYDNSWILLVHFISTGIFIPTQAIKFINAVLSLYYIFDELDINNYIEVPNYSWLFDVPFIELSFEGHIVYVY